MTSEEEQAYEDAIDGSDWQVPPYGREYRAGAAVAFGLMGWAEAIRQWGREQEFARLMSFVRDDDVCTHDDGTDPDEPADRGFVCAVCTADPDRGVTR